MRDPLDQKPTAGVHLNFAPIFFGVFSYVKGSVSPDVAFSIL
jgi:hypothetical protein